MTASISRPALSAFDVRIVRNCDQEASAIDLFGIFTQLIARHLREIGV